MNINIMQEIVPIHQWHMSLELIVNSRIFYLKIIGENSSTFPNNIYIRFIQKYSKFLTRKPLRILIYNLINSQFLIFFKKKDMVWSVW